MSTNRSLSVWKGKRFVLPVRFRSKTNGVLSNVNLSGKTIVFRASWEGGSIVKTSGLSGWTISDPASGLAVLSLLSSETSPLPVGRDDVKFEIAIDDDPPALYGVLIVNQWI